MSSGVAWIDRKVGEIRDAREHLERIGLAPQPAKDQREHRYAGPSGWRVPYFVGTFTDDQLLELARERGFRR